MAPPAILLGASLWPGQIADIADIRNRKDASRDQ